MAAPRQSYIVEDPSADIQATTRNLMVAEKERYDRLQDLSDRRLAQEELKAKNLDAIAGYKIHKLDKSSRVLFERARQDAATKIFTADTAAEAKKEIQKLKVTYDQMLGYQDAKTKKKQEEFQELSYMKPALANKKAEKLYGPLYRYDENEVNIDAYNERVESVMNPYDPDSAWIDENGNVMISGEGGDTMFVDLPQYANPIVWNAQPSIVQPQSFGVGIESFANENSTRSIIREKDQKRKDEWTEEGAEAAFEALLTKPGKDGMNFRMAVLKEHDSSFSDEFIQKFATGDIDSLDAELTEDVLDKALTKFKEASKYTNKVTKSSSGGSLTSSEEKAIEWLNSGQVVGAVEANEEMTAMAGAFPLTDDNFKEVEYSIAKMNPTISLQNEQIPMVYDGKIVGDPVTFSDITLKPDRFKIVVGNDGTIGFKFDAGQVTVNGGTSPNSSMYVDDSGGSFNLGGTGSISGVLEWEATDEVRELQRQYTSGGDPDISLENVTPGSITIFDMDPNYKRVYGAISEMINSKYNNIDIDDLIEQAKKKAGIGGNNETEE